MLGLLSSPGCSTAARAAPCRPRPRARLVAAASGSENGGSAGPATSTTQAPPVAGSKEALLARIAKAKQYKQGGGASDPSSSSSTAAAAAEPAAPPFVDPLAKKPAADWGAVASFLESGGKGGDGADAAAGAARAGLTAEEQELLRQAEEQRMQRFEAAKNKMSDDPEAPDSDQKAFASMILNASQAPERGSALRPANFLRSVLDPDAEASKLTEGLDTDKMSMEEFTMAKEARLKALGAEILTVDSSYRPDASQDATGAIVATTRNADAASLLLGPQAAPAPPQEEVADSTAPTDGSTGGGSTEGGEVYQPKVSTWGAFPRPKDISKAFGGGRNLKPGQELETKEQKEARERAYAEALQAYKAKAGLEVDPDDEAAAESFYEEGMTLFQKADMRGAYDKFERALALVPLKSKYGGLAGLQKAIILDSQGMSEPAQKLYRQLQGHAVASVSRKAKQMLFGFQAATFLKADTISYAARKGDFDRYFRPVIDRNKIWVPTEAEREADRQAARQAAVIAVVVIVGPIALAGALLAKFQGALNF